jgi:hypothetical protein
MHPIVLIPVNATLRFDEKDYSVVSFDAAGLVLRSHDVAPAMLRLSHEETLAAYNMRRLLVSTPFAVQQREPTVISQAPSASHSCPHCYQQAG